MFYFFEIFLEEILKPSVYHQVFGFGAMFKLMLLLNHYFKKNKAVKEI